MGAGENLTVRRSVPHIIDLYVIIGYTILEKCGIRERTIEESEESAGRGGR